MSYIGIGYEIEHDECVIKVLNHFTGKDFYINESKIDSCYLAVFFKNEDESEEITSIQIVKLDNNNVILKLNNYGFPVNLDFDKFYTQFKNYRYIPDENITNNTILINPDPYFMTQEEINSICSLLIIQYDLGLIAPNDEGEENLYISKDIYRNYRNHYCEVEYSMGNSISIPTNEKINELKEHIKDIPFLMEEEIKIITISHTGR